MQDHEQQGHKSEYILIFYKLLCNSYNKSYKNFEVICLLFMLTCCVGISSKETLIKYNIATDLFDGWKIRSSIHLPGSLMKTIFYLPLLNLS